MGIIYKLKQEVIDFILQKKKEDNDLSCRQIAKMASDQFDMDISKSSVNAIIKENQLSSMIGRRPLLEVNKQKRKFEIPQERKDQFRQTMKQFGFEAEIPFLVEEENLLPLLEDPLEKDVLEQEVLSPSEIIFDSKPIVSQQDIAKSTSNPAEIYLQAINVARSEKDSIFSKPYENMGSIFINSILWTTDSLSFLSQVIKKYNREDVFPENFESLLYALIMLKTLGIKQEELDDIVEYLKCGFWALEDMDDYFIESLNYKDVRKDLFGWINHVEISQPLVNEYLREKECLSLRARGFKIYLKDGSEIFLDSKLRFLSKSQESLNCSSNFKAALKNFSRIFVTNQDPIIFNLSLYNDAKQLCFIDIFSIFEPEIDKNIEKTSIIGENFNEFIDFSNIPNKKRFFIVRLHELDAQNIIKNVHFTEKKQFFNEIDDKNVCFCDNFIELYNKKLRILLINHENNENSNFLIGTNNFEAPAEEILLAYFLRWPHFELSNYDLMNPIQLPQASTDISDFWKLLEDFVKTIEASLIQFFINPYFANGEAKELNLNNLLLDLCKIPGSVIKTDNLLRVVLNVPADFSYKDLLSHIVQEMNERLITDSRNRRVFLEFSKKQAVS
ncbi:MAG: helix-turn-helix domain-containing protein [Candidatus Omnitrophica bacterium]|nr:helix-turn-helix domain-containing protein [Candidatus Omnitrophota bacterium]